MKGKGAAHHVLLEVFSLGLLIAGIRELVIAAWGSAGIHLCAKINARWRRGYEGHGPPTAVAAIYRWRR